MNLSLISDLSFLPVILKVSLVFITRSTLAVMIGFWFVTKTSFGKDRRIYKMGYAPNQLKSEFMTLIKVVPYYSVLVGFAYYFKLIQFAEASVIGAVLTFLSMFVWNEIWFYGLHRILHHKDWMFIHVDHHKARVASPFSIACFSLTEQTIHVAFALFFPIVASHYMDITLEGIVLYSVFQISVNILGHMNVEIYPPTFARSKIGKWFTTPTFHSLHHGRIHGHFGLLTTIPDRLFGTYYEDYPIVQARAALGNGLSRANERARIEDLAVY